MPLKLRPWPGRPSFHIVFSGAQAMGQLERWTDHGVPDMYRWTIETHSSRGVAQGRDEAMRQIRASWEGWLNHAGLADAPPPEPEVSDAEVDAVLAEFGGDTRGVIKVLLHDLDALARDAERFVSRGFVRGARFGRQRKASDQS